MYKIKSKILISVYAEKNRMESVSIPIAIGTSSGSTRFFTIKSIVNNYIKLKFLLLLIGIISTQLTAQSVDSLIAEAASNNLELKILEKEYLTALEIVPQVGQLQDPEVNLGIIPLPIETRLGGQVLRLGATQMLPWKGVRDSKKELALAKAKPLYERIAARQLDLAYQIKQAWYELYELGQRQGILQRNLTILETLDQLALAKVESGKATASDVLRVQLKKEALNQEILLLETAKAKPTTTINELLNRSLAIPITIADSLTFAEVPFNKAALAANISANHPIIRMFALQQKVAEQTMAVNKLDSKPDFGVGLDYILVNKIPNSIFKNNGRDVLIPKVSVKIPLYKQKYAAKEREEQLKIATLEDKKEALVSQFMAMIDNAFTDYEMAQLSIDLYQKQITITQSAITILEANYSATGNDFEELLELETALIEYDLKILKAIVQSHQAKNLIEKFIFKNNE